VPGVLVTLSRAEDLAAKDSNGLSDPFVVLRVGKLSKYKSSVVAKSLNPIWDEECFLAAPENTAVPLTVEVWDKDLLGSSLIGTAELDISMLLNDGTEEEFSLELANKKGKLGYGTIYFKLKRTTKMLGHIKHGKHYVKKWAVASGDRRVVVEAIRGMDLAPMDSNGLADPYLTMTLGKVKHTSKVDSFTLNPRWKQRFEFPLKAGESSKLKVKCWDRDRFSRDDFMGQCDIVLDLLQPNVVNDYWYDLELNGEPAGHIHLLITVVDSMGDLVLTKEQRSAVVGSVKCHIYQASDLKAADLNGLSDPYVEIRVGNARLRTNTANRTLNPFWDQVIELPVADIFGCAEISVWDEDKGGKSKADHLGSILVPLLEMKNGEANWYALKDSACLRPGKGEVLIAFQFTYKVPKAYFGIMKKREPNYMADKGSFSPRRLLNAVRRFYKVNQPLINALKFGSDLLNWRRHPLYSVAAGICWVLFCLFFRLWQLPLAIVANILVNKSRTTEIVEIDKDGLIVVKTKRGSSSMSDFGFDQSLESEILGDEDGLDLEEGGNMEDEDNGPSEGASSVLSTVKKRSHIRLLAQLRVLRKIGKKVQDMFEFAATIQERIWNVRNWSVPLITELVVLGLSVFATSLLVLPWNIVFMLGGLYLLFKNGIRQAFAVVDKRRKKKLVIPVIEFLGRVPSEVDRARRSRLPVKNTERPSVSAKLSVRR